MAENVNNLLRKLARAAAFMITGIGLFVLALCAIAILLQTVTTVTNGLPAGSIPAKMIAEWSGPWRVSIGACIAVGGVVLLSVLNPSTPEQRPVSRNGRTTT